VKYIRQQYGDYFGIAVAGHPEGHIDNPDKEDDLRNLKAKVDAGADVIVTQLFYDIDVFLNFVKQCRAIGITCPILPGIFPIQNYNGLKRVISFNDNHVPQKIWDDLEAIKDDDAAVKEYGIKLSIEFINKFIENGIRGVHFYTFNLERSTRIILERMGLVPEQATVKPLPWAPVGSLFVSFFITVWCLTNMLSTVPSSEAYKGERASDFLEKSNQELYQTNRVMG
jgi:methylenetetrahydrofolate reductase (NADPH)